MDVETESASTLNLLVHQVYLGGSHVLHLIFYGMDVVLPLQSIDTVNLVVHETDLFSRT